MRQMKEPSNRGKSENRQMYESETAALQSLRLIAAPNHEDDISVDELRRMCKGSSQSSELIQHLIEFIKSI